LFWCAFDVHVEAAAGDLEKSVFKSYGM